MNINLKVKSIVDFFLKPKIKFLRHRFSFFALFVCGVFLLGTYFLLSQAVPHLFSPNENHKVWIFRSALIGNVTTQTDTVTSNDIFKIKSSSTPNVNPKVKGISTEPSTPTEFTASFKAKATDPDSIIFDNNLGKISFYTASQQTFGKFVSLLSPVSTENSLTYLNIFPNIDLQYTISASRLLEEFIIKDKDTANKITRIDQLAHTAQTYQTNSDGSITFSNGQMVVFTLPAPIMYEADNPSNSSAGIRYEVTQKSDLLSISKVITSEGEVWINDSKRVFPIVIDLVIDNGDTSTSWISSDTNNTTVSQETTIKEEGTASVKVQTTANSTTTIDNFDYVSDTNAQAAYVSSHVGITATGGTVTTSGTDTINTFTSSGTLTVTGSDTAQVLVVAGGGSGGNAIAGGGGGGGVQHNEAFPVPSGNISVTIGNGGAAIPGGSGGARGITGSNSVFYTLTAYGGGGGAGLNGTALSGGCGGGGAASNNAMTPGSGSQGYSGGYGRQNGGGGGGGGAGGPGVDCGSYSYGGTNGGIGFLSSITGTPTYYAGGGAGGGRDPANGGLGGGGSSTSTWAGAGTPNTGGGGGACQNDGYPSGAGGSGIVIVRYLTAPILQSYSEATIKSQGSYSLKGVAKATNSLNQTLTRTISSPLDLSNNLSVSFDIRSTRTGSNIKIGLHDTGGTTTEITPNITSANTFQTATLDLSNVSSANKDAIDKIIITVVNADADNTFYIDNFTSSSTSLNNTVTRTVAPMDLSSFVGISFWVRSTVAGSFARFQFGESTSNEQTYNITVNSANTWEQKTWNISAIPSSQRDAVTKFGFQFINDTQGATFYFDNIKEANQPPSIPSLDSPINDAPNQPLLPTLKTTSTDPDSDDVLYKIDLCTNLSMTLNCQSFDQTISALGWSSALYSSGTQAGFTLQTPLSHGADYYWRSSAIDPAGTNTWSSTQAVPNHFSIDLTPPSTVSNLSSSSHTLSTWSPNNVIAVSWTAATDTNGTGVAGYSYLFDTNSTTIPDDTIDGITTFTTSSVQSNGSSIYFHIKAVDNMNNWGSVTHLGPFFIDTTPPSTPGIPGTISLTNSTSQTWTWAPAVDTAGSGVALYGWRVTTDLGQAVASGTIPALSVTTNLPQGNYLMYISAIDVTGNKGSESSAGSITVDTSPPVISAVSSGTPTSSGATITWTTDEASSSYIDYGLTNTYGVTTPEINVITPITSHSTLLSNLVSCSTYHYQVKSKDPAGNEGVGPDATFTTSGCTGASTVITESTSQIATTSGGTLDLSTSESTLSLTVPSSFSDVNANFQVHQLDTNTVIATTQTPPNYSTASNYIYEIKALANNSTIITTFEAPLTITVNYDINDVFGLDVSTLKLYRWDNNTWNQLNDCQVDTLSKIVSCTTTHFSAFGLFGKKTIISPTPSSISTSNNSSNGNGENSAPVCNDTQPASTPDLFQINITKNTAKIFFTPISNTNTYFISYSTSPNAEENGGEVTLAREGVQNYTINLLNSNTTYYFKVRGQIGCMPGGWSNIMKITTLSKNSTQTVINYKNSFVKTTQKIYSTIQNTIKALLTRPSSSSTPIIINSPPTVTPIQTPSIKTDTTPTANTTQTTPVYNPTIVKQTCILWWCF